MLREAVQLIDGTVETDASGDISIENIKDYAATGVDFMSVGSLIQRAKSIDMSLKAVRLVIKEAAV